MKNSFFKVLIKGLKFPHKFCVLYKATITKYVVHVISKSLQSNWTYQLHAN